MLSSARPHLLRALTLASAITVVIGARAAAAEAPTGPALMDEAYRHKARGDARAAQAAFESARAAGADAQRVSLELGYLRLAAGEVGPARRDFDAAAGGPDQTLAAQARRELGVLPRRLGVELYADSYGWQRQRGGNAGTDLVPTLRVRVLFRPVLGWDLHLYAFTQVTRDLASRARNSLGVPEIYSDNYALTGGGLLARFWSGRAGLFLQGGPAFALVDDGRAAVTVDGRGGLFLGLETARCHPAPVRHVRVALTPCADLYSEGVYVSRFSNNAIAFARGRLAAGYLDTGPVEWQVVVEGRGAVDRNRDFYNNFVDGGVGHRWRLLGRMPLDVLAGIHGGTYLGRQSRDPAPHTLGYVDLRLQLATFVEL